jgi:hypothetical protein
MSRQAVPVTRPTAGRSGSRWAEWLTIVVLLAMALVLLWLNLSLLRRPTTPEFPSFDLKNPMLDARPRECIEVYDVDRPGDALCVSVREEGVVLRPFQGPTNLGDWELRRAAPYLACRERRVPRGGGCASTEDGGEGLLLYPLNGLGLPMERRVRLDSLEAVWTETGGRERLVYLAVLQEYGAGGTFKCYVSSDADARVTGLVQVELRSEKPGTKPQVFRYHDVGECP